MNRRRQYRQVYLRSGWWATFRTLAIVHAMRRCQGCGARPRSLDVHHTSYARKGHEHLEDVEVLCRNCHNRRHGKPPNR